MSIHPCAKRTVVRCGERYLVCAPRVALRASRFPHPPSRLPLISQ
jgi:hypothetical protein